MPAVVVRSVFLLVATLAVTAAAARPPPGRKVLALRHALNPALPKPDEAQRTLLRAVETALAAELAGVVVVREAERDRVAAAEGVEDRMLEPACQESIARKLGADLLLRVDVRALVGPLPPLVAPAPEDEPPRWNIEYALSLAPLGGRPVFDTVSLQGAGSDDVRAAVLGKAAELVARVGNAPAAAAEVSPRRKLALGLGAAGVVLGAGLIGAGAWLIAIDHQPTTEPIAPALETSRRNATMTGGVTAVVGGAVALGAGIFALLVGTDRGPVRPAPLCLRDGAGLALVGSF